MPLRLLVYEVRIWERFRKEQPDGPLPAIGPVVLSHDPAGWTAPRSFDEMLDPSVLAIPKLADLVPRFSLLIDDLADQSNADIKARTMSAFVKLVLWALRDGRHADQFQDNNGEWIAPFDEARRTPRGIDALGQLMRYFALVTEPVPFDAFCAKIVKQLSVTKESDMGMSWLEHKEEQARTEGRVEGRAEALRKQLVLKFGPIDSEHEARVASASPEALDRYLERILTATSLDAVFA